MWAGNHQTDFMFGDHPAGFLRLHRWAVDVVGRTETGLLNDSP